MKKKTVLLLLIFAVAGFMAFFILKPQAPPEKVPELSDTPSFSLADTSGNLLYSDQLKGKISIIHFWATWCPPCVAEIPSISAFYRKNASKDNVRFIFIPYHDPIPTAKQFLSSRGITLPLYIDPNDNAAAAFGVTGVPETYVLDPGGKVIQRIIGPVEWDSKEVVNYFSQLLK